ncbi:UDP-N-acetylglucosamine 2-epimerase [Fusobacterium varium]|uniref:UDP-N-acetylglucosamine 2-epimerase n=1 Tax=Fusobacterium varium TaxID=856 RepID=UPI003564A865
MIKKICIVTGTRAEYGLLKPLIKRIKEENQLQLQILVTGMHLSLEFGLTYKQIEEDGFKIDEKIEILLSSDKDSGICKSVGLGMILFSEALERLIPDLIVVLGDRFEIFSLVSCAGILKIPVCHLHGGETTEGAYDEFFRHCITKMSYLHFTSTEEYRKRVIQLGESPERVFNVGAIGLENIKNLKIISKNELEEKLDIKFTSKIFVAIFHPVTLEKNTAESQLNELLKAIEIENIDVIFIKGNADSGGRAINRKIEEFSKKNNDKYKVFSSLTVEEYFSILKYSKGLIGNSSSGIVELPYLKVGNLNIGDRQKGRIQSSSTLNCNPIKEEIIEKIKIMLTDEYKEKVQKTVSPYGDGEVSSKIVDIIKNIKNINLKKEFYDLKVGVEK